jgi:hypothetical protein
MTTPAFWITAAFLLLACAFGLHCAILGCEAHGRKHSGRRSRIARALSRPVTPR